MRTADLIATLAGDTAPVRPRPVGLWLAAAAAVGAAASFALLVTQLGLPTQQMMLHQPWRWMKVGYTFALAIAAGLAAARLSRPGGRAWLSVALGAVIVAWLAALATMETMRTPAAGQAGLWLGQTWTACPGRIVALSVPAFALGLWIVRRMAPTRPALAGAAVGVLAGAIGASVYGLYCLEHTAAFVVLWYSLGMAVCGAIGALFGAWLLKW